MDSLPSFGWKRALCSAAAVALASLFNPLVLHQLDFIPFFLLQLFFSLLRVRGPVSVAASHTGRIGYRSTRTNIQPLRYTASTSTSFLFAIMAALNSWIRFRRVFAKGVPGELQPFWSAKVRAGWNDLDIELRARWTSAHELDPHAFSELVQRTLAAMESRPRAILVAFRIIFQSDHPVPPVYAEAAREIHAEQDRIQEKREKRKQENDHRRALSRQKAASTRRGKRAGKGKGKGKKQFETEAAGVDGEPSAKRQRRGDLARSNALPGPSQPTRYEFSFAQPGPGGPASFSSYALQASTAMSSYQGRNEALPPMVPSPWALDAQLLASGAPPPLLQLSQQEIDAMNSIPVFSPDFNIPGFDPLGWPSPFDSPAVGQSLQTTSQWAAPPAPVSHVPGEATQWENIDLDSEIFLRSPAAAPGLPYAAEPDILQSFGWQSPHVPGEATQWGNIDLAHPENLSRSPAAPPGIPYAAEPDVLQSFDWQSYNMFPPLVDDPAVALNAAHDAAQIGVQLDEPAPDGQLADTPDSSNPVTPDRSPSATYTGFQDPLLMPPIEQAADPYSLGPMSQELATMYLGGEDGAWFDIEHNQYLPSELPKYPAFDMSQGDQGGEAYCGWLPGY